MEIDDNISGDGIFASMEEIADYNVKLDKAYTKMMSGKVDVSEATKDKPVDATGLIINPGFQTRTFDESTQEWKDASSSDGWTATGGTATGGLNYEIYNDSCEIHQTLYNMPAGYYRVVYNGFYRAGDATPAALSRREGEESLNAEVYLKGKETNWTNKLASIFENVQEYKYVSNDIVLSDTLFTDEYQDLLYHCIVNDVAGAKAAFEDGAYEGNFSFRVEEGEEPVLGVRKTGKITNDWTCFDNFKLLYYGDGDANKPDDFVSSVEETVADGKATVVSSAWYTINGVRVANILLGKLNPGDIRAVTGAELKELYYEVGKNASRPARPAWEKERQPAAKKEAQSGVAEPRVNGRIANAGMQRSGQNPAHRNAGGYAKTADRRQGTDGARKAEQRGTYRSTADSRTNGTYRSATDSRTNGTYRNGSRSGQTGAQKKRYE